MDVGKTMGYHIYDNSCGTAVPSLLSCKKLKLRCLDTCKDVLSIVMAFLKHPYTKYAIKHPVNCTHHKTAPASGKCWLAQSVVFNEPLESTGL